VFNLLCQKTTRRSGLPSPLLATAAVSAKKITPVMMPTHVSSEKRKLLALSQPGYHVSWVHSVDALSPDWETVQPVSNLFLQRPYLSAVEFNPPGGMQFSYLVFYKTAAGNNDSCPEVPIGVAYCQISNFSVEGSIRDNSKKDKFPCIVRAFARFLKNMVVGKNHNLLVCGNLLLTGEHGFHFDYRHISKSNAFDLLEEALLKVQDDWQNRKVNIDGIFIKDICEEHRVPGKVLVKRKFREFTFHPNMVMELPPEWKTFNDYMAAITSKYRVRTKRAFRMAEKLEKRQITESQIFSLQNHLYELYKNVVDNQDFNMVTLHENYLTSLRQSLGERFNVYGYYFEGELVAFYTTIRNGEELEAHFLGFDQNLNREYHLYHNILLDILRLGIEQGARRIVYARTAMEIKSSVGALAHQMYCYIRANNPLTNKILAPILEYLRPPDDWVARSPFKSEGD
jgi:hypothetical protein